MIDCPMYQAKLKYDIEHIDEIEDVIYRISLKNKLGIPRTEKDQKDIDDYMADLEKAKEILNMNPEDTLVAHAVAELRRNTKPFKLPSERRRFSIAPKKLR